MKTLLLYLALFAGLVITSLLVYGMLVYTIDQQNSFKAEMAKYQKPMPCKASVNLDDCLQEIMKWLNS